MEKLRLKRHGSFSIREGWLEKAILAINENDKTIFGKETGVLTLGVGANMVTSIRYWLIASDIISVEDSMLSNFGKLLVKYDPYLDTDFSWWMIHKNLVSNFKNAPIFNITFNGFTVKNFSKDVLNKYILNYMQENNIDMSNSSQVDADTTVLLRTYIDEKIVNPEDNLNSPLGRLGLLKKSSDGIYNFTQPNHKSLPFQVVYSCLLDCLDEDEKKNGINVDDMMFKNNSPSKIFRLDKNMLYLYLNEMKEIGLITINKTAGLNMIYLQEELNEDELFDSFFSRIKL